MLRQRAQHKILLPRRDHPSEAAPAAPPRPSWTPQWPQSSPSLAVARAPATGELHERVATVASQRAFERTGGLRAAVARAGDGHGSSQMPEGVGTDGSVEAGDGVWLTICTHHWDILGVMIAAMPSTTGEVIDAFFARWRSFVAEGLADTTPYGYWIQQRRPASPFTLVVFTDTYGFIVQDDKLGTQDTSLLLSYE